MFPPDLPDDALYTLGGVVFSPKNRPLDSKQSDREYTWVVQERIGSENPIQPTGFANKSITFTGLTFPTIGAGKGKPAGTKQIQELERLMMEGVPYPLVDGLGNNYGLWAITKISDTESNFLRNGAYLTGEYSLTLLRYVTTSVGGDGTMSNGAIDFSKWRDSIKSLVGSLTSLFR